ncbi:uncharacterized protein LOC108740591 isoform X3 [Agrilus planipennis]|uniref:Uncharacterized protein LOC108740591 isoform X3 n=1 Tax=Agrilus planipennis TaxID=224129 RepID=A0A7F5R653_AGRPL|nr:uncharacterized protein LOC108740591 isoform X3 [Agrilus planipennis]
MPSDALAVAITSGLGVSLIAGIVSGICYIFTQGFSRRRKIKGHSPWHCNVCGAQFRSIEGVLDVGKVVACAKCGSKVCRFRCARKNIRLGWICRLCQQPENWLKNLFSSIINRSARDSSLQGDMENSRFEEIDEDLELLRKKEKEHVRDFIERIVEAMLGSNVDNVSVAKLYNDKSYLPIVGQSPCSAHAIVKQIIQRVIQEAIDLPTLSKAHTHPAIPEDTTDRSYEDLLATAILNKVVQSYQDELPTSSRNSASSRLSTSSKQSNTNKEYFFGEENLSSKWKNNPLSNDTESTVSLEEWVQSSPGSLNRIDQIEIRQEIEEVSSSDDEEPQYIRTDSLLKVNGYSDEWHENWMMQKRRLNGTASPVPVPMLVPNPNTEAKVKIGDKEADETSDLSDVGSDFGDMESSQDIKSILIDSKTVIGGKNLLDKINLSVDSVSEDESTDVSDMREEKEDVIKRFVANGDKDEDLNVPKSVTPESGTEHYNYNGFTSLESNVEKDTEYTERYASLPRTVEKIPEVQKSNGAKQKTLSDQSKVLHSQQNGKVLEENNNEMNQCSFNGVQRKNGVEEDRSEMFKGSYAEREKNKWYQQAVELKNNPYSEENLQRRLSTQSTNSSSSLFGREYYIKQAARSAGASKPKKEKISNEHQFSSPERNSEENGEVYQNGFSLQSPNHNVDQLFENITETDCHSSESVRTSEVQSNEISSEVLYKSSFTKIVNETFLLQTQTINEPISIPVEAKNTEVLVKFENGNEKVSSARPTSLEISSDSDRSLERVYNVETGKVMVRVGDRIKELEEETKSPRGIKYTSKPFDSKEATVVDENQNISEEPKAFLMTEKDQTDNKHVPYKKPEKHKIRKQLYTHFLSHSPTSSGPKIADELHIEGDKNDSVTKAISYPVLDSKSPPPVSPHPLSNGDVKEFSLEYSTDNESYNSVISEKSPEKSHSLNLTKTHSSPETDTEISEIRSKKLVKNLLGEFSKVREYRERNDIPKRNSLIDDEVKVEEANVVQNKEENTEEQHHHHHHSVSGDVPMHEVSDINENTEKKIESNENGIEATCQRNGHVDELEQRSAEVIETQENDSLSTEEVTVPSVQYLKKIFDKNTVHTKLLSKAESNKPVYSLTARSIPIEVRQELKKSAATDLSTKAELIKEEASVSEIPDSSIGSLDEVEDVSFPKAISKIQFFESLKK